jgi:hypothetical protein
MRYAVEVPNVVSVARHPRRARQINWLDLIRVIFIPLGVTFVKC